MNKQDRAERLEEMKLLYFEKDWTLDKIADYYKVTKQAIYDKFARNGIKLQRKKRKVSKVLDRAILSLFYEKEKLPVLEIAARLNVSYTTIRKELKRHRIEKRARGDVRRKYPEVSKLKIGEVLITERRPVSQPFSVLYYHARAAGIRISVKTIDKNTLRVTRIE